MALELIYTSARQGLKPGSHGFCTVAMTAGMPPGLVSRLARHLVNEGLLTQDNRFLRASRADALLDAWAARDDWSKRTTIRQYSLLESDLEAVARRLVKVFPQTEPLVFTQWIRAGHRSLY